MRIEMTQEEYELTTSESTHQLLYELSYKVTNFYWNKPCRKKNLAKNYENPDGWDQNLSNEWFLIDF